MLKEMRWYFLFVATEGIYGSGKVIWPKSVTRNPLKCNLLRKGGVSVSLVDVCDYHKAQKRGFSQSIRYFSFEIFNNISLVKDAQCPPFFSSYHQIHA
jgi:hypothetical protein